MTMAPLRAGLALQPAVDRRESFQAARDGVEGDADGQRAGDRGQRIAHVVHAGAHSATANAAFGRVERQCRCRTRCACKSQLHVGVGVKPKVRLACAAAPRQPRQ